MLGITQLKFLNQNTSRYIVNRTNVRHRWIILGIIIAILILKYNAPVFSEIKVYSNSVISCFIILFQIFYNIFLNNLIKLGQLDRKTDLFIVALDLLLITSLIISTGAVNSMFYFLYFFLVFEINTQSRALEHYSRLNVFIIILIVFIMIFLIIYSVQKHIPFIISNQLLLISVFLIYARLIEWSKSYNKRIEELNKQVATNNNSLKNLNMELEQKKVELSEKNKDYLDILGTVNHELQNPVSSIKSLADTLRSDDGLEKEDRLEYSEFIYRSVCNMEDHIKKFLSLARIEHGQLEVSYRRLELFNDIIENVITDLKHLLKEKNMRILKKSSSISQLITWSDPELLRIVFNNVLGNAIKYGYANTDIYYQITVENGIWLCDISNSGQGIPADKIETVFAKFERLENSINTARGTGLGLFNTREILKKMNGRIWCRSELNGITVFSFSLPILEEEDVDYEWK